MNPISSRGFLVVLVLGLAALSLWIWSRVALEEEKVESSRRDGANAAPARGAAAEESLPASFSGAAIQRATVDPQEAFIARWQELYADSELRQRVRDPRKKLLEEMRRTHEPFPYEEELQRLAVAGVVPAPPKQAFEDLILEEMDHARNMLRRQVQSLSLSPAAEVQRWRDRESSFVNSHSLYFAPVSLAAFLLGRDVTSDLSWNHTLVAQLAAVRTRALRAYAQAWEEYQYAGLMSLDASLETDFELPSGHKVEETAKLIPEARAVLDRVNASHADYLRDVREALRSAFPGEAF